MRHFFARLALVLALLFAPVVPPAYAIPDATGHLNKPLDAAAVSVGATATKLIASPDLTRWRRGVIIQPTNGDIYLCGASGSTTKSPIIYSGQFVWVPWTFGSEWYAIRSGGSNVDVRVLQVF